MIAGFYEKTTALPVMGIDDKEVSTGLFGITAGLAYVGAAIIDLIAVFFGVVSFLFYQGFNFLLITVIAVAFCFVWLPYGNDAIEGAEHFARADLYPVYQDTIRLFLNLFRYLYNAGICAWNGLAMWGYRMVVDVIFPVSKRCGLSPVFTALYSFIVAVSENIIFYIASGDFRRTEVNWAPVQTTGINLFQSWINFYMCTCWEGGNILRTLPIINPFLIFPPLWPTVFFSQEWTDPQTWCAFEYGFKAGITSVNLILNQFTQVISFLFGLVAPGTPYIRPDIVPIAKQLCPAFGCAMRSLENATQLFWDTYIPFDFNFYMFFSPVDSLLCIAARTIALLFNILVNIDRCVLYPQDPYWADVIKPDVIEIVNRWATPTNFPTIIVPGTPQPTRFLITNYYLDTTQQALPNNLGPNPVYGVLRFTEALCIFINRIICDPAGIAGTPCFSNGAQNLLFGLDFCCFTTTILDGLADVATSLFEFSLHITSGGDNFFLYLDRQPFTAILAVDLTRAVQCVLQIFSLIPVVGSSIQALLTGIAAWIFAMVDFFIHVLIGLGTLPYYLIVMPSVPNFVTKLNQAVDYFTAINNILVDTNSSVSVINALCVIANNAFPVPPIPCGSCYVGGFIPPPPPSSGIHLRMFNHQGGTTFGPADMHARVWGRDRRTIRNITPLILYANTSFDPFVLYNQIWVSAQTLDGSSPKAFPFHSIREADSWLDQQKNVVMQRWRQYRKCRAENRESRELFVSNRRLWEYNYNYLGKYRECAETITEPVTWPKESASELQKRNDGRLLFVIEDYDENDVMRTEAPPPTPPPLTSPPPGFTLAPLIPPISSCSPTPQCIDFCCTFRTVLIFIVQLLNTLARFFNGIIQGATGIQGTAQAYPYFTGEAALQGQPTFESDLVALILGFFDPFTCICQLLNLIIPVPPDTFTDGRPDMCCAIERLSELIADIIQVIINSINALALGSQNNYAYFREGMFTADVTSLFTITEAVVTCLCSLLQVIFPLNYIPGFARATNFDICCFFEAALIGIIEIVRFITVIIISLGTITVDPNAYCFWRLDVTTQINCGGTLDDIGFVKAFDRMADAILPTRGNSACFQNCKMGDGESGLIPCVCGMLNTLLPFRTDPSKPVNCSNDPAERNCMLYDFCCPFVKVGLATNDLLHFLIRAFAGLWQSWDGGLPEFFIHYIWCSEPPTALCAEFQTIPLNACQLQANTFIPNCPGAYPVLDSQSLTQYRCGKFTCGKFNIVIADLVDPVVGFFSTCLCQFFGLVDELISMFFDLVRLGLPAAGWSCCFCGGTQTDGSCRANTIDYCRGGVYGSGSGLLPAASYAIQAILQAAVGLIRQFPFACYWHPCIDQITGQPCNPGTESETWIFQFLGPTADALSIVLGNLMCFAQSLFFLPQRCLPYGQKFIGSFVRWIFEAVFRIVGFIEGFIQYFITVPVTCIGPTCDQKAGSTVQTAMRLNAQSLGNLMISLFSFPFDLLIGDSFVACTTLCPPLTAVPSPAPCDCWNLSPNFAGGSSNRPYIETFNTSLCLANGAPVGQQFGQTSSCCIKDPALVISQNLRTPLPLCQNPDDVIRQTYYPGSCVVLAACRPDNLPSIANDPLTPPSMSANYKGAIDGILMGLLRYFHCMLDSFLPWGCTVTNDCTRLGYILYPGEVLFSIVWQILGGVIRFIVSLIIFLLSLFNPPSGNDCNCWESSQPDGYGQQGTQFYRHVPGFAFCYPCNTLRSNCDVAKIYPGVQPSCINFVTPPLCDYGCSKFQFQCRPYCPIWQLLNNPTFNQQQAFDACVAEYETFSDKYNPYLQKGWPLTVDGVPGDIRMNGTVACRGWKPDTTVYDPNSPNINSPVSTTYPAFNITVDNNSGACKPPTFGSTNPNNYILLDLCVDPHCQTPTATTNGGCTPNATTLWPCGGGGSIFDCSFPANPLVLCSFLQVLTNFLGVVAAFVNIFTQPIMIPTASVIQGRFIGPVRRETFQQFQQRYQHGLFYYSQNPNNPTQQSFAENAAAALYDYDSGDCYSDVIGCACRNLPIAEYCFVDPETQQVVRGPRWAHKRGENISSPEVTGVLAAALFNGDTTCDNTVAAHAGQDWDREVPQDNKHRYVDCVERRIQGERLSALNKVFPKDTFYNAKSPAVIIHNLLGSAQEHVTKKAMEAEQRIRRRDPREEAEERFPNFQEQIRNRTEFARTVLLNKYKMSRSHMLFDAIVRADEIWFKYQTGWYGFAFEKTVDAFITGRMLLPQTDDALRYMKSSLEDLGRTIVNQPYGELASASYNSARGIGRYVTDVLQEGVMEHAKRHYADVSKRLPTRQGPQQRWRMNMILEGWRSSPIYYWIYGQRESDSTLNNQTGFEERSKPLGAGESILAPFWRHMKRVVAAQRAHWERVPWSAWNADLKLIGAKDLIVGRWGTPKWTTAKADNYARLRDSFYRIADFVYPGSISEETRKRIVWNTNCQLLDLAANVTLDVVDYCVNEYIPNFNNSISKRSSGSGGGLFEWVQEYSRRNERSFFHPSKQQYFRMEHTVPNDPQSWIRPRWIGKPQNLLRVAGNNYSDIDHRTYRHARNALRGYTMETHGPAGWNFYDWLLVVIEDWSNYALGMNSATWFAAVRDWFANSNTSPEDWPNVGFLYWLTFEFKCVWPWNLNCSIGIGLELALYYVTAAFIALSFVTARVLPLFMLPFELIGLPVAYVMILTAVAWNFSMRCLFLFPAFPLPFGVALPMCAMDQVMGFLDKWITNCYSPWLIPPYMIQGQLCPTDPNQYISVLNCRDVGVSDGIQNILFLGTQLLGQGFVNFVLGVGTTAFAWLIPGGVYNYLSVTMTSFTTAGPTQMDRMWFCFYYTLPSVIGPLYVVFAGGIIAALVVPPLLLLIGAILALFFASPNADIVPGSDTSTWYGSQPDYVRTTIEPQEEEEEEDVPSIAHKILYGGVRKPKKLKKK